MPRYKLTLEYDGRSFHGFQYQDNLPTVQGALEDAIFQYSGEKVTIFGAGRTDRGVHARMQVVHMDMQRVDQPHPILMALNFFLRPLPLVVTSVDIVPEDFHARFSATSRAYTYRIINRRAPLALDHGRAWHIVPMLNVDAMDQAAKIFIGTHDFTSFRAAECQSSSPIKTIDESTVFRINDHEIHFYIRSKSFLHHQVRTMIGTLKLVGTGKRPPEWIKDVLAARGRSAAGQTAPADGLYLDQIFY